MSVNGFNDMSIEKILANYEKKIMSPVEVAKVCIEQIEKYESKYHAWTCFDNEQLLKQAKDCETYLSHGGSLRAVEGIPIGVKDIFNTIDFPTEMGSPIWKGFTPGNDARVVHQMKMAGAVVPGKTVTAEFAVHTLGKTLNPHDITRNPGTSSSGSAVAVALGMVPVALGTQTAGSIVRPSSFCGVYGCKPSFGLIPRTGMLKTTDSLDTVGFFVHHFEDMQRVWEILRVDGRNYPISNALLNDSSRQSKPQNRPWKIAVVKPHVFSEAPTYALELFDKWVKELSQLIDIEGETVELPETMIRAHEVHATIYNKCLAYYFKEEFKKAELVSPIMNSLIEIGNTISNEDHQAALREQENMARQMDELFMNYDIMISLSTAGEAPLREECEKPDAALMWTMTHLPVINVPALKSPTGLPFGIQLVARRYNDLLLFKFAEYLRELELIPEKANSVMGLENS